MLEKNNCICVFVRKRLMEGGTPLYHVLILEKTLTGQMLQIGVGALTFGPGRLCNLGFLFFPFTLLTMAGGLLVTHCPHHETLHSHALGGLERGCGNTWWMGKMVASTTQVGGERGYGTDPKMAAVLGSLGNRSKVEGERLSKQVSEKVEKT
jgi:hypothetical protein